MYETVEPRYARYEPSKDAWVAMILLTLAFAALIVLIPSVLGHQSGGGRRTSNVVPEYGTVEYERFTERFEKEYGRPYTVSDQLDAAGNGAWFMAAYFGACTAFMGACLTVHDCARWAAHRRGRAPSPDGLPPREPRDQLICSLVSLAGIAILLIPCLLAPHFLTPVR